MISLKKMIVIGCSLLCLAFATWGIKLALDNKDGPCIITEPLGAVKCGRICTRDVGMFNSGYPGYILYYPGTYKHSGKKCYKDIWVTKSEYERRMYKPFD